MTKFIDHLSLAQNYWKNLLLPGDFSIDATCGNGHDTLSLANICLTNSSGSLLAIDIQEKALENTFLLLKQNLPLSLLQKISLLNISHENLDSIPLPSEPKLIVYNLGYLPGADKLLTTKTSSTLLSVEKALSLITPNGAISITCYPGHEEGKKEEEALLQKLSSLDKKNWTVCFHSWPNRPKNPSLFWIIKKS